MDRGRQGAKLLGGDGGGAGFGDAEAVGEGVGVAGAVGQGGFQEPDAAGGDFGFQPFAQFGGGGGAVEDQGDFAFFFGGEFERGFGRPQVRWRGI